MMRTDPCAGSFKCQSLFLLGGRGGRQTGVEGAGTHTTHLSYQISVFRVDQDYRSQPLQEGEGFVELRRGTRVG